MSSHNSAPVSGFSANSKNLKSFRAQQRLRASLILVAIAIPLIGGVLAYNSYKNSTDPNAEVAQTPTTTSTTSVEETPSTITTPIVDPNAMPEGVTVALNSIEQNGMKNNTYVNADTNAIPAGTSLKTDRTSWIFYGSELGAVNGTVSYKGEEKKSTITFQVVNGAWKVTGYSIAT